jgi:formylglycine-generating enzyme required for sulfatase activity
MERQPIATGEASRRKKKSVTTFPPGSVTLQSQANYYSSDSYSYDVSPTRGFHPAYIDVIYPYSAPVGSFQANGYGLYDMTGNLWEWCNDRYSSTYYSSSPYDNPAGPASGSRRVFRGGGFISVAEVCRRAFRGRNEPDCRSVVIGFRVVLDLE